MPALRLISKGEDNINVVLLPWPQVTVTEGFSFPSFLILPLAHIILSIFDYSKSIQSKIPLPLETRQDKPVSLWLRRLSFLSGLS